MSSRSSSSTNTSKTHSVPSTTPLHYEWIHSSNNPTTTTNAHPHHYVTVVLHGLLGNIRNIKTLATKLCQLRHSNDTTTATTTTTTSRSSLMIDLTGHGKSAGRERQRRQEQPDEAPNGSTTLMDVVRDVGTTIQLALQEQGSQRHNSTSSSTPPAVVTLDIVGHSLGGRVALLYASSQLEATTTTTDADVFPRPQHIWLLDTVPDTVDTSVRHVLSVARNVIREQQQESSTPFISQHELTPHLQQTPEYNLSESMAQWLASQYNVQQRTFQFDLDVADSLVLDLPHYDFWQQVHCILDQNTVAPQRVHLVMGGKNLSWTPSHIEQVELCATRYPHQFAYHMLPNAGHWVHIDDLPGLLAAFESI